MVVSWHTTDLEGETQVNPDTASLRAVLGSLRHADDADFPDVSLVHGNGWAITVNQHWVAVLERAPDDGTAPATLPTGSLEGALELWRLLAAGETDTVLARPWRRIEG